MRASEIFREAWRNVAGGAARAGWLTSAFVLLIGLLSLAELATVSGLDLRARQYHDAGASIRILKVERAVDAHRCDMLPVTDGIVSAGALRSMAPLGISSLRGLTTPAFEVSRGFQAVLGLDDALEPGALISEPLAKRWDVRAGDTVATDQGSMRIAAVFPYPDNDGRDTRLANAVLLPALGQSDFDECWADVWPSTAGFDSLIRTSLSLESKDASASIMTLNPCLGQYFSGAAEYRDRVTRFMPLGAALVGCGLGIVGGVRRRLEYASGLHAGISPTHLSLISLTEVAGWAGFSALTTTAIAAVISRVATPSIADAMVGHLFFIGGAGALGAVAGAMLVTASTREAKLFKYFKQRS